MIEVPPVISIVELLTPTRAYWAVICWLDRAGSRRRSGRPRSSRQCGPRIGMKSDCGRLWPAVDPRRELTPARGSCIAGVVMPAPASGGSPARGSRRRRSRGCTPAQGIGMHWHSRSSNGCGGGTVEPTPGFAPTLIDASEITGLSGGRDFRSGRGPPGSLPPRPKLPADASPSRVVRLAGPCPRRREGAVTNRVLQLSPREPSNRDRSLDLQRRPQRLDPRVGFGVVRR